MHPERVDLEMVQPFRVAGRDVAGYSFIKTESGKQAKRGGQHTLAAEPAISSSEWWKLEA
jgi:hypothetical protein